MVTNCLLKYETSMCTRYQKVRKGPCKIKKLVQVRIVQGYEKVSAR